MMTVQAGTRKVGTSGLVRENKKRFLEGLKLLSDQWEKNLPSDLAEAWFVSFQDTGLEAWGDAVKYWLDRQDHFPIPIEMRRALQEQKRETELKQRYVDPERKLLTNGPPREHNQEMARELINLVQKKLRGKISKEQFDTGIEKITGG